MCFVQKYQLPTVQDNTPDDNVVEEETTRTISFTINDGTNAIQGATVTIGSDSKTTGSAGGCSFSDIEDGEISVTVTAEGFVDETTTITVDSTHTSFTISLTATQSEG